VYCPPACFCPPTVIVEAPVYAAPTEKGAGGEEKAKDTKTQEKQLERLAKVLDKLATSISDLDQRLQKVEQKLKKKESDQKDGQEERKKETKAPVPPDDRAVIVVEVPADARVYLDGEATKDEGAAERSFVTPPLTRGQVYYYLVRMDVVRNGERLTETRRVAFQAGSRSRVSFVDQPETDAVSTLP
jgi:uncharacterized protein (TIGR03000 family)